MAPTYTSTWGLTKPDPSDQVNVQTQLNDNMDTLDNILKKPFSVTSGLDWSPNSDWQIVSYSMSRAGGNVTLQLEVQYIGANITSDAAARFTGLQTTICYIPVGWDGAGFGPSGTLPVLMLSYESGRQGGYFGRLHPQSFSRAIEVVSAAFPGQAMSKFNNLVISATYSDANWKST